MYLRVTDVADCFVADRHRPYLMTRVQGTNDYINAIFVDVCSICQFVSYFVWLDSPVIECRICDWEVAGQVSPTGTVECDP